MSFQVFQVFQVFRPFEASLGEGKISQPVALEDPATAGTYLVNAGGELLTSGTQKVKPQE